MTEAEQRAEAIYMRRRAAILRIQGEHPEIILKAKLSDGRLVLANDRYGKAIEIEGYSADGFWYLTGKEKAQRHAGGLDAALAYLLQAPPPPKKRDRRKVRAAK